MSLLSTVVLVLAMVGLLGCTVTPPASPAATAPLPTATAPLPTAATPAAGTTDPLTPSPAASPVQSPTLTQPPVGPTPPPSTEWTPPVRLSDQRFDSLALAVDPSGRAQAAAGIEGQGIWYLGDAGEEWLAELVAEAPAGGSHESLAIAVADDGTIHILFVRWDAWNPCYMECPPDPSELAGLFHVVRTAAGWTEPVRVPLDVVSTDWLGEIDLAQGDDGLDLVLRRVTDDGDEVWYGQQSAAGWRFERVTDDGWSPNLDLVAGGMPLIAYTRGHDAGYGVVLARREGAGNYSTTLVDGSEGMFLTHLALDGVGNAHLLLAGDDGGGRYTFQELDGWSEQVFISRYIGGAAVDAHGALHVLADEEEDGPQQGLWYLTNRFGGFERLRLDAEPRMVVDAPGPPSALAVDSAGRPHVLFANYYSERRDGLWYGMGPSYPLDD
jgi:hypothetical protein